ncbi:MAG: hypothetical protein H7A25_13630 [Leptospiraceae bacterium]|nr:hypothetical protein [Leptospiraceae bacterium]
MQNLNVDNFSIHISEEENKVILKWKGKSEFRNPSEILNPYFDEILSELKSAELHVDFTGLEFMNSSTFPAILNFMKKCDQLSLKTLFIYNASSEWQNASFKPLKMIGSKLNHINFEAK